MTKVAQCLLAYRDLDVILYLVLFDLLARKKIQMRSKADRKKTEGDKKEDREKIDILS